MHAGSSQLHSFSFLNQPIGIKVNMVAAKRKDHRALSNNSWNQRCKRL